MIMRNKLDKLRAEQSQLTERIERLRVRSDNLTKQITELENLEIVGIVRGMDMTPEQLAAWLRTTHAAQDMPAEKEGIPHAEK